ncbi:MAG: orotidine-5'-phosphate decarboxylase [Ignavibacteriaceae bacterium]
MPTAVEKLYKKFEDKKHICVGLDPDPDKFPATVKKADKSLVRFCRELISSTSSLAAAYKLNIAFFECHGPKGWEYLEEIISFIPEDILTIADGKRNDIGNSARMYAKALYDYYKFDSATVNPYMGFDSAEPFLTRKEKLTFYLALTSNPGSADFEKLKTENNQKLYLNVISNVKQWNTNENCGIVFGATHPQELRDTIAEFGNLTVLLPGVGTQGGNLEETVNIFSENKYPYFLINQSRDIIYASSGSDFADAAAERLAQLNKSVVDIF